LVINLLSIVGFEAIGAVVVQIVWFGGQLSCDLSNISAVVGWSAGGWA